MAFAHKGAAVVLAARNGQHLKETEQAISVFNKNVMPVVCDVSKETDCKNLIDQALSRFGKIDVLINNAGVSMRALFTELDLSVLKQLMDINFWGAVYCTKYALPHILKQKGSVVGISSIAGKKGLPGRTGYSASKFALEGFLETIRIENLKNDLHVMVVCPGFTTSNIRNTALSKDGSMQGESPRDESSMMSAEEVALRIVNGVEKRKRDLVMTLNGKLVVFLNRWFPSLMDKSVYNHMAKEPGSPLK